MTHHRAARSPARRSGATLLLLLAGAAELPAQVGRIPPGFTPIFNGKDLSGWHVSRTTHHGTTPSFTVEDGAIVMRQRPYGQGGLLLTDKKYRNFELYLEAKPDWGTNGGIFFRSTEGGSAYQIELEGGGTGGSGSLIGEMLRISKEVKPANIGKVWKPDEWNSMRLRVVGDVPHVALWVNGVRMWDVTEERNDLIADATDGMIALQLHWGATYTPVPDAFDMSESWKPGAAHRYRNIAIKELR